MRRPRNKLQVSTFPFLAVLLCAMGSLLLLLFIMDRRAKIAAQHHSAEALSKKKKRTQEEEDARTAEWEKAKDRLRRSLVQEQGQLKQVADGIRDRIRQADGKLDVIRTRQLDATTKIAQESAKIGELRLAIETQRVGIVGAAKKETATRAELLEAAKELADLEFTVQQVRTLKEREKEVFSLVPYRGKQGDLRKPIYVECTSQGVIFQPDGYERFGASFTAIAIRDAIEARAGKLVPEKSEKEKSRLPPEVRKGPYVLFLVRPDGIANYYKAQSVLRGQQIDFGYELIDADWTFDFAAKGALAAPMRVAQRPRDPSNPPVPIPSPPLQRPAPVFNAKPGIGQVAGSPDMGVTVPNLGSPLAGQSPIAGLPNLGGIGPAVPSGPLAMGSKGPTLGGNAPPSGTSAAPPPRSTSDPSVSPIEGGGLGGSSYPKVETGIPVQSPSFVPIAKGGPSISPTPNGGAPQPIATNLPGGSVSQGVSPINTPIPGNSANPGTPGVASGSPAPPSGTLGSPFGKPTPGVLGSEPKTKPTPTPALGRILGNKDFLITIDCYADHVTVFPGGVQFRWTATTAAATDQALAKHITNLIARRQASVRADEPPYRPVIRFQVSTEGVQTYLRAYPILEPLRVSMTRENVED